MKSEQQFLEALRLHSGGSLRVKLDSIQSAFGAKFPHLDASPDRRTKLRDILDGLAATGGLRLPADRKQGWQNHPLPALPLTITLSNTQKRGPTQFEHRSFPWVAELAFLAKLPQLRAYSDAQKIHGFLMNGGSTRPIVPTKERSWEIFGNEKRLDALVNSELFGPGKLTLEVLRCRVVTQVLAFTRPTRPVKAPFLIVENECTFHSFSRLNHLVGVYSGVILGDGHRVLKATSFLQQISTALGIGIFHYFGDLDQRGLEIGQALVHLMAPYKIDVVPADALYRSLLKVRRPDKPEPISVKSCILDWMPPALRLAVHEHLTAFGRIAQEGLGWERISAIHGADPNTEFAAGFAPML